MLVSGGKTCCRGKRWPFISGPVLDGCVDISLGQHIGFLLLSANLCSRSGLLFSDSDSLCPASA